MPRPENAIVGHGIEGRGGGQVNSPGADIVDVIVPDNVRLP